MTGFGSSVVWVEAGRASLTCELRSVNQKSLEIKLRLPAALSALEGPASAQLRAAFSRGRIDAFVRIDTDGDPAPRVVLDEPVARQLLAQLRAFATREGLDAGISVRDLLVRPEIFRAPDLEACPPGVWQAPLERALRAAADDLLASRDAEGKGLQADLSQHLAACARLVEGLALRTASAPQRLRERLQQRIAELGSELSPERLAQEVALLAERVDVSEELARLRLHLEHFQSLLCADEPVGRKLDFLCQELNREANTVGSKCADAGAAHLVVELKAAIERVREQVQNVE